MSLKVLSAGLGVSVQDLGRPGLLVAGQSRGGAMDRLALTEGAALLGQDPSLAALEMAGMGGQFEALADLRIALTGALMRANLDGMALSWHASHLLPKGAVLEIGPATRGSFGYVHLGGGIASEVVMGARSADLKSGILGPVTAGDILPVGPDTGGPVGQVLDVADRFSGGTLRIVATAQTPDFPEEIRGRLVATQFLRDPRSNRQAVRLDAPGDGFAVSGGLTVLSEITQPGDIQITGDGVPFILMSEAQSTGGYPRIGAVLPCDLPKAAQAPAGAPITLQWLSLDDGLAAERKAAKDTPRPRPLLRDPRAMNDLLSYRLTDGAITGWEEE